MKINNMDMHIQKGYYNKSTVEPDGITYKIDTSKQHSLYTFNLRKVYFDASKEETLSSIIEDLQEVINTLKKVKEHNEIEL